MSTNVTIANNLSGVRVTVTNNNSGFSKVVVAPYPVWLGSAPSPAFVVDFDGNLTPSPNPVIVDLSFSLDSDGNLTPS